MFHGSLIDSIVVNFYHHNFLHLALTLCSSNCILKCLGVCVISNVHEIVKLLFDKD